MIEGVKEGVGRGEPYGSSTNVLNYKSEGRACGLPGGAAGSS